MDNITMPSENNPTYNETLSYEAHMLQEILRINELMMKQAYQSNEEFRGNNKVSHKNYARNSMNRNNISAKKLSDEAREIHFRMISKSVSSLQGKNVSSNTTVFKVHSKTTLKKTESKNNKYPEADTSSKKDTSSKRNSNKQSFKVNMNIDDKLDIIDPLLQEECVASSLKKEKNKIFPKRIRNIGDRIVDDNTVNNPVELVEIYKKEINSENDLNRETSSIRTFSKENNEQCEVEENEFASSKIKSKKHKKESYNVKNMEEIDKIDKIEDFQIKYIQENDQNDENIQKKYIQEENDFNEGFHHQENFTSKNNLINEDLQKKYTQENYENNENFDTFKRNISETTFSIKSTQDEEDRIINMVHTLNPIENETIEWKEQNDLNEDSLLTLEEVNPRVNLVTIFEVSEKTCTNEKMEKLDGKNGLKKSEASENMQRCSTKGTDDLSICENTKISKSQKLCANTIENIHSLEHNKYINNIMIVNKEKKDISTITIEEEEHQNNDSIILPKTTKSNDSFIENSSRLLDSDFLKSNELADNELMKKQKENISVIEKEEIPKENHQDNNWIFFLQPNNKNTEKLYIKTDNLNSIERINFPNDYKYTDDINSAKIEENSMFKNKENSKMNHGEDNLNIDSYKSNTFSESSIILNENEISKISMQRNNRIDNIKDSSSNLSSDRETINRIINKKLKLKRRNSNTDLSGKNKIKVVIEKRENKKNDNDKNIIDDDKTYLCDENVQPLIDKNKKEDENSQDFHKESTRIKINNNEQEKPKEQLNQINNDKVNICQMLIKIHERLTSDWQRLKRLQMKLQISVSMISINPMMMFQLLDKTITRCKSYIHGANDSYKAETEITNILLHHVIELVKIMQINKTTLENQEQRIDQMQLELLQGHQTNKKRIFLNEIILTSNYWTNEIFYLIKNISCLVKQVMAENEEKENLRNLGRHKRHINNISNDTKYKVGMTRLKNTKLELVKKESNIETQMSMVTNPINPLKQSKSKTFTKSLYSRGLDKEKHLDDTQSIIDKKIIDNRHLERKPPKKMFNSSSNQYKQSISRQKHRNNQQPVWKPGGAVKFPNTSNSATMLKFRPMLHIKEKTNLDSAKEEKQQKRGTNDCKKKPSKIHSTKDIVSNMDNFKMIKGRSTTSLKISPRTKTRGKISRPLSKTYESLEGNKSLCDMINQKIMKDSKVLKVLEEIIKDAKKKENKNSDNETNTVSFKQSCELIAVKEEMKINEEEPTRDIDSEVYKKNKLNVNEGFQENLKMPESIPENYSVPIISKNFISVPNTNVEDVELNENVELNGNFQPKIKSNFASENNANCVVNFTSSSVDIDKLEVSKLYETCPTSNLSPVVSHDKIKENENFKENNVSQICILDCNEKQEKCDTSDTNILINKPSYVKEKANVKEKTKVGSHTMSLVMLKEFLCNQGIDVNLVNKAEKYLKNKQRMCKGLKKKSISFADVPSSIEYNCHFKTDLKKENNSQEMLENDIKKINDNIVEDKKVLNEISFLPSLEIKDNEYNYHFKTSLKKENNSEMLEKNIEKIDDNIVQNKKVLNEISLLSSIETKDIEHNCHFKANLKKENNLEEKLAKDIEKMDDNIIEDKKILNEISLLSLLKTMKDVATDTLKDNNNAYSQTSVFCKTSKSLQTILENNLAMMKLQAMETQTEREQKNAFSMMDLFPVIDNSTETEEFSYIVKFVNSKNENDLNKEDLKIELHENNNDFSKNDCKENFKNISTKLIEELKSTNIESTENIKVIKSDKNSSKECSQMFQQLLDQIHEECDESLSDYKKDELFFNESEESLTSAGSSKNCIFDNNKIKKEKEDENQSVVKVISSGIVVAFQVAAIRARNIYRSIRIYKRKLRENARKLKKESKHRKKINEIYKSSESGSKSILRSNSVANIIMQKKNDKRNGIIELFKNLKQTEITSPLSETSFDSHSESENNSFRSVKISSSDIFSNEMNFENIDLRNSEESTNNLVTKNTSFKSVKISSLNIFSDENFKNDLENPKKSFNSIALKDIRSLMEFLVNKTGDIEFERIECVQKISNNSMCKTKSHEDIRTESLKRKKEFRMFSKTKKKK
ncbi:protein PF14_0175-like isoform X2 [Apis laboriosa]|uniref:protein PF14_0175-like isoform X2 n=1 Tax=Apis laboriosa TaxID=183418 RepID=UPI001CC7E9FE|nr:protein PF14_0175-like isoform X2 [Apis laboriosa]